MEIVFCQKKNEKLVHGELGWNPESEIAVYKVSTETIPTFRMGGIQIYNYITTYRVLSKENTNLIHDYIRNLNGRIVVFDDNFESVMKSEGLDKALGNTQIIKIDFTTTKVTNGKNCEPCEC